MREMSLKISRSENYRAETTEKQFKKSFSIREKKNYGVKNCAEAVQKTMTNY